MGQAAPDAIRTALFVPARTATAFYHKTLAPELLRDEQTTIDEAQTWALDDYAPAWEQRAVTEPTPIAIASSPGSRSTPASRRRASIGDARA